MVSYTTGLHQPWNSKPVFFDSMNNKLHFDNGEWQSIEMMYTPDPNSAMLDWKEVREVRKWMKFLEKNYPEATL